MTYIQRMIKRVSAIRISVWMIPVILFAETLIAYGILGIYQGFYFDDWPMVWMIKSGSNFWQFYAYDRPFSAWTLALTAPLLGTSALAWHLFSILLRWLVTLTVWWVLRIIWRNQLRIVTLISMLFAVYPAFIQQPISVAYSQHFITYLLFLLSFGFMLMSLGGSKRRFWLFTTLALITQGLHLFTMEYFWGLELVRVLGLFFYIQQREPITPKEIFRKAGKFWLPYLVMLAVAVFWRLFIYSPVEDPNQLRLVAMFLANPASTLIHFIEMVLRDSLQMLIKTWDNTLQVNLIDLKNKFQVLVWGVSFLVAAGLFWVFRTLPVDNKTGQAGWRRQLTIFGLAVLLLGPLPVWLTNKQITIGKFSDRFALGGMLGASILLVVFLDWVLSTKKQTLLAIALLAGLAIGLHLRTGNDYRWAWVNQSRFYWQMHWRVPDIQPNTAVFSNGAIFRYTGDYPTAFALNLLYPTKKQSVNDMPVWFFELDNGFFRYVKQYLHGIPVKDSLRNISFSGWSLDSILIDYNPEEGSCLWVVAEGDELIHSLPALTRQALPMSDLSRIKPESGQPPASLFGKEPPKTWCYYFEKAELARQMKDWEQVSSLAHEAIDKGYEPQNRFEWRPFIDGFLHTGEYRRAREISMQAYESGKGVGDMLCDMWHTRVKELPNEEKLIKNAELIEDQLHCKW